MKSLILTSLLFSSLAFGQILIHSGSQDDMYFSPPSTCTTGGTCAYSDNAVVPANLRYGYGGTTIKYDIPAPLGLGILYLGFYEPNKTGAGQRVFTVSINGSTPITLDIYKLAGGTKKYWAMPPQTVVVNDGFVHIVYTTKNGANPLTAITDYRPNQLTGPEGKQGQQGIQGVPGLNGADGKITTVIQPLIINCVPAAACVRDPAKNTLTIDVTKQ